MTDSIDCLAGELGKLLSARGQRVTCAESCTGGGVAEAITRVAGSSGWFDCGFVTYANSAKAQVLGVDSASLARHGAVSETVVREMAVGARARAGADWAVATSGIAGPGGGTPDKPVGTVWIGVAGPDDHTGAWCFHFAGNRSGVREAATEQALAILIQQITV